MLAVSNLGFNIGNKPLLSDFSMNFEQGKMYALVGHNGSGKSTLLKLLAKQQKATSGDILLENKSINNWSNKDFAKHVAYLPQDPPMTDGLTGQDLVSFGRYPWHGLLGRLNQQDYQYIEEAMRLTDTNIYAQRLVDTLSGGERQRLWLAMLLAQRSKYLLLDEPLSALDIAHQVEMLTLIRKLCHELNLSVIIIVHDINMASRFCDHIVAVHSGKMLLQGHIEEVFLENKLQDIYNIPMHIMQHPAGYPIAMPGKG